MRRRDCCHRSPSKISLSVCHMCVHGVVNTAFNSAKNTCRPARSLSPNHIQQYLQQYPVFTVTKELLHIKIANTTTHVRHNYSQE
jgi:hypothetical protein